MAAALPATPQRLQSPSRNRSEEREKTKRKRAGGPFRFFVDIVLGLEALPEHSHRDVYDRLFCGGNLILQLHAWDEEDHPNLVNADAAPPGHGLLLWFEVEDFDAAVKRARSLGAQVIEEPHVNPNANHREMWLRDPDGYVVVVASRDGEATA